MERRMKERQAYGKRGTAGVKVQKGGRGWGGPEDTRRDASLKMN